MLIYAILTGYFFLFVLAQFVFKFHKNVDNRKLKDGERMISVDYIKNILEHYKVGLPLLYTLYIFTWLLVDFTRCQLFSSFLW